MNVTDVLVFALRMTAVLLWLWLLARSLLRPDPRRFRWILTTSVAVVALGAIVVGGLYPFHIPFEVGRMAYTAVATYAVIVALALISVHDS